MTSQAGLPANYTFTTGTGKDNGMHTFSATLKTAGTQYLTATDTTTSSITGTQSGIVVQAVASGLVAEWTFDEGSGTTAGDATGNNHTGTLVGNVTWTAGEVGPSALSFNPTTGTNPHVVVADAPDLRFSSTQSFTLGAWVYVAALPGQWTAIVAKSRDHAPWYGLWISNTNHWVAGGPANLTGGLVTTGWHYLTLVQNGTANQRLLYVDGVQAAAGAAQNANGPGDLWIGGDKSVSEFLNGSIDDVRLYQRALSASEVQTLASFFDPAAPTKLSATAVSGSQINLAWTDNASNESSYQVQRSLDGVSFSTVATLAANSTSYSDTGLSAGDSVLLPGGRQQLRRELCPIQHRQCNHHRHQRRGVALRRGVSHPGHRGRRP